MFQPRVGVAWDVARRRQVGAARQRRRLLRAAEHAEPGRIGDDQRPAAADDLREHGQPDRVRRADAGVAGRADADAAAAGQFPLFSGVRVFDTDYENPRIYAFNVAYEQELAPDWSAYVDFTWTEGPQPDPVPELQPQRPGLLRRRPGHAATLRLHGDAVGPQLDEVMVTNSLGESRYRGLTLGIRKRFSQRLSARRQLRAREGRGRRLERARSVHRSQLQLLRSRARLGSVGSRHPAQVQRLRLLRRCPAAFS